MMKALTVNVAVAACALCAQYVDQSPGLFLLHGMYNS